MADVGVLMSLLRGVSEGALLAQHEWDRGISRNPARPAAAAAEWEPGPFHRGLTWQTGTFSHPRVPFLARSSGFCGLQPTWPVPVFKQESEILLILLPPRSGVQATFPGWMSNSLAN